MPGKSTGGQASNNSSEYLEIGVMKQQKQEWLEENQSNRMSLREQ